MNRLTRQEQLVLISVIALLGVGLVVKYFRVSQPRPAIAQATESRSTNVLTEPKE